MKKCHILQAAGFLLTLCLSVLSCGEKSSRQKPNVLIIMTDQQSVNTIGAFGSPICRTPNLDRIAEQGMIFLQCHVASYPCSPSRASILSGRYSHNHGVVTNDIQFSEEMPSLGNLLKAQGYATAYFGKYHLGGSIHRDVPSSAERTSSPERDRPWNGRWTYVRVDSIPSFHPGEEDYVRELKDGHVYMARPGGTGEDAPSTGFDHWRGGWKQYRDYLRESGYDSIVERNHSLGAHGTLYAPHREGPFGDSWHAWSTLPEEKHQEAYFANEAMDYLENIWNREQPFGMVLSFYGPHHPLLPPRPWDDMYPLEDIPLPASLDDPRATPSGTYRGNTWTEEQFRDYIRRYWGFISFIDAQIGKVLGTLDEMGELDQTILLFTSDHGDMAGEHGHIYKNVACSWDELIRVPLILSYPPEIQKGTSSSALVSNIDFLPTLLDLAGIGHPGTLDGESFLKVLHDPTTGHRKILFTSIMGTNFVATTKEWKYNLNILAGEENELYDRAADPDEMHNLSGDPGFRDIADSLKNEILRWLRETGHPYAREIYDKVTVAGK